MKTNRNRNIQFFIAMLLTTLLMTTVLSAAAEASSPLRVPIKIGKNMILQVRGIDAPHMQAYSSIKQFIHQRCYHIHGELKVLNSKGREIKDAGRSIEIPLYCKGTASQVKKAVQATEDIIGISLKRIPLPPIPVLFGPLVAQDPCLDMNYAKTHPNCGIVTY